MISAITSIINGIQSRNAAKNASREQVEAALRAAGYVDEATGQVNAELLAATLDAINGFNSASEQAATGIEGATTAAQTGVTNAAAAANAGLDPYAQPGQQAMVRLSEIAQNPAKFEYDAWSDPGTQRRIAEAQKAIERSAAARGTLLGGGTLKAITDRSQEIASDEFARAFDRFERSTQRETGTLLNLAGVGLDASTRKGGNTMLAAQYAGDVGVSGARTAGGLRIGAAGYAGDNWMRTSDAVGRNDLNNAGFRADMEIAAGDARAAGHIGAANAWSGMWNQIGRSGDAMLAGGYSGGGGFNWRNAMRGPGQSQQRRYY